VNVEIFSREGKLLFATAKPKSRGLGFSRAATVLQPLIEEKLRAGLSRFDQVELKLGHYVAEIACSDKGVTVSTFTTNGTMVKVEAQYLLGCDGGKSSIRKLCDIKLLGSDHVDTWLVIDLISEKSLPTTIKIFGGIARPAVMIPLPHRYQRWEFRLFAGEDMPALEQDHQQVIEWISAKLPIGKFEIIRQRIYRQSTKIAASLQQGRVFLLGDAAHLMPPFAGQGLCSGVRDATNLCWKLAMVIKGQAHLNILTTYELERRPHIIKTVQGTKFAGFIFFPNTRSKEILRDTLLKLINLVPGVKKRFDHDTIKPSPVCKKGLLLRTESAGLMLLQPYVKTAHGITVLMDEILGKGFAILGVDVDPRSYMNNDCQRFWHMLNAECVHLVMSGSISKAKEGVFLLLEGQSRKITDWFSNLLGKVIALRPDRYIAFICKAEKINSTTKAFQNLLLT
jgi:3-(3-hydroxy-phenyl)propionate hydroxylase